MTRHLKLLALGAAMALAGCRPGLDPQAALTPERNAGYQMQMNGVGLLEPALQRTLTVEANGARRSATNTLDVFVTFRSRSDNPTRITVRTRFMDADRRPLDETQWTELFLERRGLKNYNALSKTAEAAYYYVEVQPVR